MGTHSPTSLQHAIFFYCGLCFCLRGGEEHCQIKLSQFEVKEMPHPTEKRKMIKALTYAEHGSKNRQGLVHQVHLENEVITRYANPLLGESCFVHLSELYVSLLSQEAKHKDLFYCKPRNGLKEGKYWYFSIPVGHNPLSCRPKAIFDAAGMDSSGINDHGLRASGITSMFAEGVSEKLIMQRSGHLSVGGVRSYKRTTDAQKFELHEC